MRLADYIEDASCSLYKEGEHDCATFVARWVDQLAGTDYAEGFLRYRTILEGRRKFAPQGIGKRVEQELRNSGFQQVESSKPGDIAILENDTATIVGPDLFCYSVPLGMSGLVKINLKHAVKLFRYVP